MSEEKNDKIWCVVHSGVQTFLGALCDYATSDFHEDGRDDTVNEVIQRVSRDIENGKLVKLAPVMELAAPLQQVRQQTPTGERVGVAKSPLPMPYGFTTGEAKLRVRVDAVAFLDEMTSVDRKLYHSFIKKVMEAETEERAARSGLTIASSLNGGGRA